MLTKRSYSPAGNATAPSPGFLPAPDVAPVSPPSASLPISFSLSRSPGSHCPDFFHIQGSHLEHCIHGAIQCEPYLYLYLRIYLFQYKLECLAYFTLLGRQSDREIFHLLVHFPDVPHDRKRRTPPGLPGTWAVLCRLPDALAGSKTGAGCPNPEAAACVWLGEIRRFPRHVFPLP